MNSFSKNSEDKLKTMHPDLQKVFRLAINRSCVDFGISEGHRSMVRQYSLFLQGKTTISGLKGKGKHNYNPSLAGDVFVYIPDVNLRRKGAYDPVHLAYVSGIISSCAQELYEKGEIKHLIRWGGNWDNDGIINWDQGFDDMPHHELRKP